MSAEQQVIVQVTRAFNTTPERVFDAWLDPERARKFLFATPTGEIVRVEIEASVGGGFCIVDRRDGVDAEHYGQYLEIDRPHRLVFRFAVERNASEGTLVIIEIVPTATGCELTLTHEMQPQWAEYAERTRDGWTLILEVLAGVTA